METKPWAIGLIIFCTSIIATAQLLLKAGTKNALSVNPLLIFGLGLYVIGALLLIVALKYGELSVLYPLFATSYVWVSLLSPKFFPTDAMNPEKWAGVAIIIAGVFLIGKGSRQNGN